MKKGNKMTKIIVIAVIILLVIIIGGVVFFISKPRERISTDAAKGTTKAPTKVSMEVDAPKIQDQEYVENQVIAVADSKREAKKIAEAIGGTLLSYDNQVAVIQIGVTVEEMMQMLEEDPSLPKVSPNYQNYTTQ